MLEIKDEIIEGSPRYNVTDNADGTKNIELANNVLQAGTPLNKANLEKAKFETIAPIFLTEGGKFANYGVKTGETINKGDYVIAEEIQTNIGAPNQMYLKQESWETEEVSANLSYNYAESLKFIINGNTYFIVMYRGATSSYNNTIKLYKCETNGVIALKQKIINEHPYGATLIKPNTQSNSLFVLISFSERTLYIDVYNIENERIVSKNEKTLRTAGENYGYYQDYSELGDNLYAIRLYDKQSSREHQELIFLKIKDEIGNIEIIRGAVTDPNSYSNNIVKIQDGTLISNERYIVQVDTENYTISHVGDMPEQYSNLIDNMRNLNPQNDEYYIRAGNILKKMIIKPSTNTYTTLAAYELPITSLPGSSKEQRPFYIVGEMGDNLIISENPNNNVRSYQMYSQSTDVYAPLHLIMIKKDFSGISYPDINVDLAFRIYSTYQTVFWNGYVYWTVMVAENSAKIFAYRGYDNANTISYLHDIQLKPYEMQIRPIKNVSEKILGIADTMVGTYDTPARAIEQIVEKNIT